MTKVKQVVSKTWGIYAVLVVVIWIAFVLRLINIEAFGFWTDEGLTPLRSSYPILQILRNDVLIQEFVTKDTHPPFYYLIIHFSHQLLGETDFAYRFPSALAGVLLVPVMYQFGRRLRGVGLGLLVAGLTAVNPLQIWYANEARMYTVFVLLLALASYVLWRALSGAPLMRSLVLYMLLAGLAFYTHYTAVFLIAGQAIFWVWLLWHHGQKKLIMGAGIIGLIVAIPLIPFTIPRLFTGAEANFSYISPYIMLHDVVRFFSLGLTVNFGQAGIQLLIALMTGLLFLGFYAAGSWRCRAFLFVYLLAVVFGLMVGSLLKPMYQGVRHIMAGSPAFILLIAWGIYFAWEQVAQGAKRRWVWAVVGSVSVVIAFGGAFFALYNLYNHPELYAKDDFRAIIRYIENQAGDNDIVVYNNAILLPLHDHYQRRDDLPVTAVPRYPYQAVPEAPALLDIRQKYDRVWFVTDPPADDRDEDGLVETWLENELVKIDQHREFSQNGIVESLTFSTAPSIVNEIGANSLPLTVEWPGIATLHGITLDTEPLIDSPIMWLNLYWGAEMEPPSDMEVQFLLQDQTGETWLTYQLPMLPRKAISWPEAELVQIPYRLPLPLGLPPGAYTLLVQPIAEDGYTVLGDLESVATFDFSGMKKTSAANLMVTDLLDDDQRILFDNGLQLTSWVVPNSEVHPGHVLPMTLYWESDGSQDIENLQYELVVIDEDGTELKRQTESIVPKWLTTWPADTLIMTPTGIYFSPEVVPGRYRLQWRVLVGDEAVTGKRPFTLWKSDQIEWGEVDVIPWPLQTELPSDTTPVDALFGDAIRLHGYTVNQTSPNQVTLDLVWQAREDVADSATLFVHLVSKENGEIIMQQDRIPGDMLRPTNGWRAGEVVSDTFDFALPADIDPSMVEIVIGLYNPDDGVRLPVLLNGESQVNDQLPLTTVTVHD